MRIAACPECDGTPTTAAEGQWHWVLCGNPKCRNESPRFKHIKNAVEWWNEREVYRGVAR